MALSDQRITADGVVVIKAQTTRSQEQNKADAIQRLQALVDSVAVLPKRRKATKPTKSSQRKRLDTKSTRGMSKNCAAGFRVGTNSVALKIGRKLDPDLKQCCGRNEG